MMVKGGPALTVFTTWEVQLAWPCLSPHLSLGASVRQASGWTL